MKRCAFIYNPRARGGSSEAKVELLQRQIRQMSGANLFRSQSREHISELVHQQLQDYDVFVACGGDGTVREVASGLLGSGKTLGIIPLGSGNDLCKSLNIPRSVPQALALIRQGDSTAVDVGRCNDFIFLNSLGFGFDGLTNRYALEMSWLPSFLRYAVAALRATATHRRFNAEIEIDGTTKRRDFIMVSTANGRVEGGSFWIAPEASLTDGLLNLVAIRPIQRWLIPLLLPLFLFKKPDWIPHVEATELSELTLSFDETPEIHADGEIYKNTSREYHIQLIPNGLHIIC